MTVGWDETGIPARWQGHHARAGRRAVSRKMAEPVEWTPPKCWFRLTRSWLFDGLCLRLRRGRLRGVRLVLCGELLPDPGGDGVHVHLLSQVRAQVKVVPAGKRKGICPPASLEIRSRGIFIYMTESSYASCMNRRAAVFSRLIAAVQVDDPQRPIRVLKRIRRSENGVALCM